MTAKKDAPSNLDALAEDAVPDEYPPDAPKLLDSYLQIRPRSKRAVFKEKLADLNEKQKIVSEMNQALPDATSEQGPEAQTARMRVWAAMDNQYQLMDDLMAMAAIDPDAYREWSDTVEDLELAKVFGVFMKRSQPGEASSSAT